MKNPLPLSVPDLRCSTIELDVAGSRQEMKKKEACLMAQFLLSSLTCMLSVLMLIGCQHEQTVQAGREKESDIHRPSSAPQREAGATTTDIKGEFINIDMKSKTVGVRVVNGMQQTFKFDHLSTIQGLQAQGKNEPLSQMQNLVGKEGSEVTVTWKDEEGAKMATNITVTELSTKSITKAIRYTRY